jgi:hypothetical protein
MKLKASSISSKKKAFTNALNVNALPGFSQNDNLINSSLKFLLDLHFFHCFIFIQQQDAGHEDLAAPINLYINEGHVKETWERHSISNKMIGHTGKTASQLKPLKIIDQLQRQVILFQILPPAGTDIS